MSAKRFYKFRPIIKDFANDHGLDALFNSYAVFSSRKNFNDLFDSKIDFVSPTPLQIQRILLRPDLNPLKRAIMGGWVSGGAFTPAGIDFLSKYAVSLNSLIDTYPIYSLSIHNDCNLLWAHYASNHTGFCIEIEFPAEQPSQVSYQEHIGSISLVELLEHNLSLDSGFGHLGVDNIFHLSGSIELGERVREALLIKLMCWSYEGEHRWLASNSMGQVPKGQRFIKIDYDPNTVKAVIFGCRMPSEVKSHILNELPFTTEFQQAVEMKDHLEIAPFNEHVHL